MAQVNCTLELKEVSSMWNNSLEDQVTSGADVVPPYPHPAHLPEGATLVVRAEEALIVVLVLILWVAAIVLFFNRWGKIRMLEPYQPKFHQEHRSSCPMAEMATVTQHRTSFSKYNVSLDAPLLGPSGSGYKSLRPRQNSVFVGSAIKLNPPRKTKSAMDLQSLVMNETSPGVSKSMLPILSVERRPNSCVFPGRRPSSTGYLSPRRPSAVHLSDLLPPGAFTASRERRPSFNNVIAQVTAERRPSSSMLRISNV
ncbi:uncharacterized protein LOC106672074 isoform X2 [Cimex lectularius]|uniref:Fibronectin type III domain-containing protein n=1 Tax=Cimex lectularius TaxID=79782 RepID=A0A8I6S4A0_CIMLE|nr:uncharacterized protein LOC106672074 isoform X2 [Cimex lectularius]